MAGDGSAATAPDRPLLGMAMMMVAVGLLTMMDGTGKYLARHYPLWQVVWARYSFNLLALLALVPIIRVEVWKSRRIGLQLVRGATMLGATFAMFLSLKLLPMAETYAIGFLSPVLVALLAGVLLRERVDRNRWGAALIGFLGILVVVRPGSGIFGLAALAPVAMALTFALYQLITRHLGRYDSVYVTMFWSAATGSLLASLALPWQWRTPDPAGLELMAVMGILGLASHLLMIRAFALAPASLVSPLIYTQMLWAIGFGFLVFGDWPDGWTVAGAGIVVASGLLLFRSQRQQTARRGSGSAPAGAGFEGEQRSG